MAAEGRPPGLIGYVEENPVGWVQVGLRHEFPTLDRSRLLKRVDDAEPWTINCFVVRTGYRKRVLGAASCRDRFRGQEELKSSRPIPSMALAAPQLTTSPGR